jgi:predicted O-linked N-acetylglucosamine transferase (SPINDLY family)
MDDLSRNLKTALAHQRAGRLDAAEAIYEEILARDPGQADALHLTGMLALARGEAASAVSRISEAILQRPDAADFHANMANAYLSLGRPEDARGACMQALILDPGLTVARYNLGNALFALGEAAPATQAFRDAVNAEPRNQTFWTNYLFALNFSAEADRETVFEANREWGRGIEAGIAPSPPEIAPRSAGRLRLAYYLPELDRHVTPRFVQPLLPLHDRAAFEVLGFGHRADGGPVPPALSADLDGWTDTAGLDAAATAAAMREAGVHILLHPCAFKARYRLVLAHRAAPLQVINTNLVSTTGLEAADHLVTDAVVDPPGETERFHTENLIRLSGFNCYRPADDGARPAPAPGIEAGHATFGSFNNPAKLSAPLLAAWARILTQAPASRLALKHRAFEETSLRDRFAAPFRAAGVAPERLEFLGFTPDRRAYLEAYGAIDLVLDPFPFGGGTTSYEALWMGVPVLTLKGETVMGRLGASIVARAGLKDFVCASVDDYVAKAVALVGDIPALAEIRQGLGARAGLFDAETHVKELDAALLAAWQAR